jgi:hypothetical protein
VHGIPPPLPPHVVSTDAHPSESTSAAENDDARSISTKVQSKLLHVFFVFLFFLFWFHFTILRI